MSGRENKTLHGWKRRNWTRLSGETSCETLLSASTQTATAKHGPTKSSSQRRGDAKLVASATLIYAVLTFPRSYGVIIRVLGCSLAGSAQRLYCNSFPPFSSHPFCNDTYNLMFSRKRWAGTRLTHTHTHTHTHTAIQQLTGPVHPTNMGDATAEERDGTRRDIFISSILLLTLNMIYT